MRKWTFKNGITVHETEYDHDLHCFEVYNEENYLGAIYPDTIEDMENCIKELDAGDDPITCNWEDGMGNNCTLEGWGNR